MSPDSALAAPAYPLAAADLCVKCGLCLPHCPTYDETRHEGDSPRGRITLMQGLATGLIGRSHSLEQHLDGCLGCRACESVCPAKVPYGELIDAGRALLAHDHPARTRLTRWMGWVLTRRRLRQLLRAGLWLYQRSRLQAALQRLQLLGRHRLARLDSLLPSSIQLAKPGPTAHMSKASVQLFSGCVSDVADQATLNAIRNLLHRIGLQVEEPAGQTCCGALYQHAGLPDQARQLLVQNVAAFSCSDAPIAFCASGCGASLLEYAQLQDDVRSRAFVGRTADIHRILQERWPATLKLQPLPAKVLMHLPCSQRNVVGGSEIILALLRRIPELEVVPLDASGRCCGAAGSYFITQPDSADQLLQPKLDTIAALAPDYIISSNIGCALHLAGGLRRQGLKIPVLHPAALLAQQLPPSATAHPDVASAAPPARPE